MSSDLKFFDFDGTKVGSRGDLMIIVIVTPQHRSLSGGFSTINVFDSDDVDHRYISKCIRDFGDERISPPPLAGQAQINAD